MCSEVTQSSHINPLAHACLGLQESRTRNCKERGKDTFQFKSGLHIYKYAVIHGKLVKLTMFICIYYAARF